MAGFVDQATITVGSGAGGNGAVSFRREKYVPRGGPDGGDGGRGGDVIFVVQQNLHTLSHLTGRSQFRAEDGRPGGRRRRSGAAGAPVRIPVPPGTVLCNAGAGAGAGTMLCDLIEPGREWVCLTGGAGGAGNARFATAVRRAPRSATPGKPRRELRLHLQLRTIADIGLVGLPNAGKSTLLRVLSNARPRVAPYPFTTTIPHLGVLRAADQRDPGAGEETPDVVIADLPGILAGASTGVGLGLQFLDHITRARMLAYVIDLTVDSAPPVEPDPTRASWDPVGLLKAELRAYHPRLADRRRLLIGTKQDLDVDGSLSARLRNRYPGERVVTVSARSGYGLPALRDTLCRLAHVA